MNAPLSSLMPGTLIETGAARVSVVAPSGRLSLRARGDLGPLNTALGLTLPAKIGQRAAAGGLQVIRLGPDEWTIHAPMADVAGITATCAAIYGAHPHSLVDISGREMSVLIDGPRAAELLTLGCARDIATIPVGEGRRTIFDGATVILWREAGNSFRMDLWHSFAPHILHLLETGCKELAAEAS